MKTKFFRIIVAIVLVAGISASADAQLKGVLNKAKKAVKERAEKSAEKAVDSVLGNDSEETTTTSSQKSTSASKSTSQKPQVGKSYGSGPEIPEIMSMKEPYSDYDASGQFINSIAWGLRKTSRSEAKALAEKLTARVKWDMKTLEALEEGENRQLEDQLFKEIKNWQYFYVKIGEIMNLMNMGQMKKDNSGAFTYQSIPTMNCGMHQAGIPASEEGVMGRKTLLFTKKDGKSYFCDDRKQPVVVEDEDLAVAKLDLNLATNIYTLFEGYPLEWCRMTQQDYLKDQFDIYYNKAKSYATILSDALKANSPENLEFQPMPKAGSMQSAYKAKALAAAKGQNSNVIDIVITSNNWNVQKNNLGVPLRRCIYGYEIVKTKYGKRAIGFTWAEDHLGGGKYGSLHAYGVGGNSFYVK